MDHLRGRLQHYDWGSPTALAELRAVEPTGRPEAEVWFGAHPSAPATVDRGSGSEALDALIAADPSSHLGPAAGLRSGTLPYLVKFLAADAPLSIQAHPDRATAEAGFVAENDADVSPDSPERTFRDAGAKPELVVAVTPFRTLCGFRPVDEAIRVSSALGLPDDLLAAVRTRGPVAWAEVVGRILAGHPDGAVEALLQRCGEGVGATGGWSGTADLVLELSGRFPGDPALALVPLLAEHHLESGEALFLAPGVLHAYLGGVAVEVMAASDNVVRGGLTGKHVDVDRLVGAIDPEAPEATVQRPGDRLHLYDVPAEEFSVWRLDGAGVDVDDRSGPDIVVCVDGSAFLSPTGTGVGLDLAPGGAAWIPHADGPYRIDAGGLAYRVTVGEPGA